MRPSKAYFPNWLSLLSAKRAQGTMSRGFALLVVLLAGSAFAQGKVLLFRAIGSTQTVRLSGHVFKYESSGHTTFSRNLRSLLSQGLDGADIEVRFADLSVKTVSDGDGNFEATFTAAKGKPFEPGLQVAEAKASGAPAGAASVEIMADDAPFFVVSDFDDTLVVSEVLNQRKAIANSLFNDARTSKVVEGMPGFMKCLREDKPSPPAFALVSGSPIQYGERVQEFLSIHRFPVMGLYLRDMGPSTLSGYKQPIIRKLLQSIPQSGVMVGDSGEHDPEVYAQMKKEFPAQVKAIFIHDVGRSEDKARFKGMVLFKQPEDAAREAVKLGLMTQECVDGAFVKDEKGGKN